jgi:hypothetical protein
MSSLVGLSSEILFSIVESTKNGALRGLIIRATSSSALLKSMFKGLK